MHPCTPRIHITHTTSRARAYAQTTHTIHLSHTPRAHTRMLIQYTHTTHTIHPHTPHIHIHIPHQEQGQPTHRALPPARFLACERERERESARVKRERGRERVGRCRALHPARFPASLSLSLSLSVCVCVCVCVFVFMCVRACMYKASSREHTRTCGPQ